MTRKTFNYDGDFYSLTGKIFDYLMLTIIWIACCLPLITIVPSTAAFYYTTVKVMRKDRGHMLEEFFKSFKANFKQGIFFSVLFVSLIFVTQFNIGYSQEISQGNFGLFLSCFYIVLTLIVIAISAYTIAALSRFNMSFGWLLKIGIYMTFKYFFSTIAILIIILATYFAILFVPFLIVLLPTGAMIAISYVMERLLQKHTPVPENDDLAPFDWYRE